MNEHKLFMNGEWAESSIGETFENINPANLELIGTFHKASEDDVKLAVDCAEDAFEYMGLYSLPACGQRYCFVLLECLKRKEELARLMIVENQL